jgi:hypothetical protein
MTCTCDGSLHNALADTLSLYQRMPHGYTVLAQRRNLVLQVQLHRTTKTFRWPVFRTSNRVLVSIVIWDSSKIYDDDNEFSSAKYP